MHEQILIKKNVEDYRLFPVVSMNWTKTIQKGERILRIPLVPLCPVQAYGHSPASDDAPLFPYNCFQAIHHENTPI